MSEVFEGYERQYCELSANLSRKCTSAALLNGGKRIDHMLLAPFYINYSILLSVYTRIKWDKV